MLRVKKIVVISFLAVMPVLFLSRSKAPAGATVVHASGAGPAEIYAANCAKCHGADGRARTARGKRAGATDFTSDWNRDAARGIRIITNGKGEMPSFKGKLTAADIRSVFSYVTRF